MSGIDPESTNHLVTSGLVGGGILTLWGFAKWSAGRQVKRIDKHQEEIERIKEKSAENEKNIKVLQETVVNDKELRLRLDNLKRDVDKRLEKMSTNLDKVSSNVDTTREDLRGEFLGQHEKTQGIVESRFKAVTSMISEMKQENSKGELYKQLLKDIGDLYKGNGSGKV